MFSIPLKIQRDGVTPVRPQEDMKSPNVLQQRTHRVQASKDRHDATTG